MNSKLELESVREVQARLKVSKPTVYALLHSGELRSLTIGTARRILSADVDALIERRLVEVGLS